MKLYLKTIPNIDYIEGTPEEMNAIISQWVDVASIPEILGASLSERLQKYLDLRDNGILLVEF